MIENAKFNFRKGDTYSRDFTISDYEFDIDKVFFSVKNNSSDKRVVLQKTLDNGITLVSDEEGVKTYNILIDATDTDNMKVGYDYFFDIEIYTTIVGGSAIKQTPIVGTLTLKEIATDTANEG